ncbi:PKD domain-containing protein [Altericista sp. CCNU0014]|uniref:PKD domain-containing protein n=1 Tax=Altericista sp. CCNU0014 TaxID=3082949 RepID=UPI00384C1DBF
MNTTLTPGVRKLPSALDIQILNAVRGSQFAVRGSELAPAAALSAGALIGINNGGFDTVTDWYTRGDSQILNGQAILSEDSPYLSHLSQTFVIPQGAKALQFTLINTDLRSSNSSLAPGDAFEVALLNHTTNTSVLAPLTGLSNTDALLNIQSNGQTYLSNAVTLGGVSGAEPRIVQIDVSTLTPGTVVTLYFDLLGFGTKDSTVTIDDVQLLAELSQAPIANDDSATTNQNTAITVDILNNDRDPDGTLNPSSLIILQAPQHGQVSLNPNGTVTYQPTAGYTGSDQFTYAIQDNSGVYSNPATVNLSILNPIPTINQIDIDSTLSEGTPANFSATATISGNQPLTYTWDLGDSSSPIAGQTINHTYANNGTYTVTLSVNSNNGPTATEQRTVTVNNIAPTANAGPDQTADEGQTIQLSGTYTDPGILDTHTLTWDFGDGSAPITGTLTPTHIYADNGTYTVSFTVTDKDGGSTTDTLVVTVNNVAPTIATLNGPVTLSEGDTATFSATATDPGTLDTLTYTWTFGDGSTPIQGQTATHTFADNGLYTVSLTVTDNDGATTTQTLTVEVTNIAPIPTGVTLSSTLTEGNSATFSATATDPGTLDTLTYTWTFGDGTPAVTGQSVSHTYPDNGTYAISLTVTDKDGATTTRTFPVTVATLPPNLTSLTVPSALTEGQPGTYTAAASDPGNDTLTYTWDFGDGTVPVTGTTVTRAYRDNGTYTATLLITDKDGTTVTHTFAVTVSNAAPSADIGADLTSSVGTPVTFQSAIADPGLADTQTLLWDFDDGNTATGSATPTHTYTQPGTYTVTLTTIDKDGAATTDTLIATIQPLALPALTVTDIAITESDTTALTATFTVNLTAASTQLVTVAYTTANGTVTAGQDYTPTSGILTFAPGQTSQTVQIQILGDRLTEGNETFFLNLSNATHATLLDDRGQATILDNESVANPGTNTFAIRTEGTFTMNGSGDLDGDALNPNDDARIYAAKGYTINGNPTLPVQRDAAGNILTDASGKPILVPNAIVVSPGYTVLKAPTNKYTGFTPTKTIPLQPIDIPAYADLRTQTLNSRVATGTPEVTFNASLNPLNTLTDWNVKFPAPGTATQPNVVRVTGGGLNIPDSATLSHIVIIVENGDINFNGSGHTANNVVLIANNGNINLNTVNATDLAVFASGSINTNGAAKFNGLYNLLATGSSTGNVTFNGSTKGFTGADQIRVFSSGNITFNGSSNTRGSFTAVGSFTFNGSSTLYGNIATKGNITFNGSATVFGAAIDATLPNIAPTNLTLSASSLAENTAANTLVGTFSSTDQNTGDIQTYQLASGTGSTDNAAFSIVGDRLILNAPANYEAKSSYSIRVRTTDRAGASFEKVFTVAIADVNEAPTAIALSASSISENNISGIAIGTLTAIDPDLGDTQTFQLVGGAGSTDNALFSIANDRLVFNAVADYEIKASYSVRVRAIDRAGLFSEQIFFINVNDVNEAPIQLLLSQRFVLENNALNTLIGIFSTIDQDRNSTFTYELVSGMGSIDNGLFAIQGNELRLAERSDFEVQSSYSIRVRVTDSLGLSREEMLTISVLDRDELPLFVSLI